MLISYQIISICFACGIRTKDWKFTESAFETVDRKFGFGIDALHHHITDGHVVHHLFFTQIPHYNLPVATKALRKYLEEKGLGHMYRLEQTFDFPRRVHSYLWGTGFRARRYDGEQAAAAAAAPATAATAATADAAN